MKKQKRFLGLSVFLVLVLLISAIPNIHADGAGKVKLNTTKTTVYIGKTKTLKLEGTSQKATWSSSNKKVATVSSKGKVTAKKAGKTTITAKVSGKKYKCTVTVKKPYLNETKKTLMVGKSTTLKLTGASIKSAKSSNKKVATVSQKGKVKAKKTGKAVITITDQKGNTYKCSVTVVAKHKHKAGDWEVTKKATCKAEGTKVKKCTVCNTQLETAKVAKTDHTPGDWVVTKEATCSTNGSKHKVCTVCGVETAVETITANGTHKYSWSTNGDTRTMKCGCGATGITEYKYGNVWGYFDDAEAKDLWYYINEERKSARTTIRDPFGNCIGVVNVSPLNKNDSLMKKAKNRATEAAANFDHGEEEHECLAWGYGSAEEAMDAWGFSASHLRAIINSDYTIGGIAFFWYDSDGSGENLTPIAVLELGY